MWVVTISSVSLPDFVLAMSSNQAKMSPESRLCLLARTVFQLSWVSFSWSETKQFLSM